jgi:NADPH:quinone reductase
MRALANRGGGAQSVDLIEVPDPQPAADEALVRVSAVAVNRGELRLLSARDEGWRPGQDVAGVVAESARDGSGPNAGTPVVAWPGQAGWAELVAVPTTHLAVLSPAVRPSEAATLPVAGVTALRILRRGGDLDAKKVLVTGASGGVGRFAVELAAGAGAIVTAIASRPDRAVGLADIGASQVVGQISDAAGPFDLILESVGGTSLEAAVGRIGPGGTIVIFGNSSNTSSQLSFGDFRGRAGARIEAFFVYESGEPPTFGEDLQILADKVADGSLHPQVGLEVSWTDANRALRALADRQVIGKAVLLVD